MAFSPALPINNCDSKRVVLLSIFSLNIYSNQWANYYELYQPTNQPTTSIVFESTRVQIYQSSVQHTCKFMQQRAETKLTD